MIRNSPSSSHPLSVIMASYLHLATLLFSFLNI
uniref:Uncharacterized protein n=1 Tax=Myoviridae sp. ct5Tq8 TaxID=2826612 RepID=A0A8S5NEM2_9CAUD|nr:MAG TPA: hypothetical protein [Myoviridae sp. ct5Tq8]